MENIGSVSFARASNFEKGSSSSQNHVNNLEEEQRLTMLPYHRIMQQRMPHSQRTEASSSSNTKKALVYPPGSRFLPTKLGLVRVHLRNKVDKKKSGFITTLDLYKDEPWLLDHVQNHLFPRGEWYYFSPRNRRGGSSCNRTVGGRGGGTWKSTTKKEPIRDKNGKVKGYEQSLSYNKTNLKGETKPTGWTMTEYCLYEDNQDDLVLCHVKGNINTNGFVEAVKTENILSNQVQEEEAGANGVEMRTTLHDEDHGQQQQQQEQDTPSVLPIPPHHDGHGLGVETMQNNDHNLMRTMPQGDATQQQQQQPQEQDAPPVLLIHPYECHKSELMMAIHNLVTTLQPNHGDPTQQQQQQEQNAPVLAPPPPSEGQDSGFERMMNNDNNFMMTTMLKEDHGDATQQKQQQEQDAPPVLAPPPPPPLIEGQDSVFERMRNDKNFMITTRMLLEDHGDATQQQQQEQDAPPVGVLPPLHEGQDALLEDEMMNNENNFMTRWAEDQQFHQLDDDPNLYFTIDELFS